MNYAEIKNKQEWEGFLKDSKIVTSFFQSWNWGVFQQNLGNKVMRFGFFDDEQKLFAIAQGIEIRAKRGNYLYIRNGPVSDWKNEKQVDFLMNLILKYAKHEKLWFIRISPLVTTENETDWLESWTAKHPISPMSDVDALDTWVLDITKSDEELLQNMRKTTRYEIRKAEKDGVIIEKTQNIADIDKFYPVYEDTIKRQKWTGYSKEYIKKQFSAFVADNSANIFLAKYQGKYIAASIFLYHGNSSYYHYSGSLTEFRKIPAPALIQWHNIQEAKSRGLKEYNFWGIAPESSPNHPWNGLSFFKMGFGGEARRFLPTRDIPVSPFYWLTNVFERMQKKRKGY